MEFNYNTEEVKSIFNTKILTSFTTEYDLSDNIVDINLLVSNLEENKTGKINAVIQLIDLLEAISNIVSNNGIEDVINKMDIYMFGKYIWVEITPVHSEVSRRRLFGKQFQNLSFIRKMGSMISGKTGFYMLIFFKGYDEDNTRNNRTHLQKKSSRPK